MVVHALKLPTVEVQLVRELVTEPLGHAVEAVTWEVVVRVDDDSRDEQASLGMLSAADLFEKVDQGVRLRSTYVLIVFSLKRALWSSASKRSNSASSSGIVQRSISFSLAGFGSILDQTPVRPPALVPERLTSLSHPCGSLRG